MKNHQLETDLKKKKQDYIDLFSRLREANEEVRRLKTILAKETHEKADLL